MTSASSSDDVQPERLDLFLLEEAISLKALRMASACTALPLLSSKLPRIGDKDPSASTNQKSEEEDMNLHRFRQYKLSFQRPI